MKEVKVPGTRCFYYFQIAMGNVHSKMNIEHVGLVEKCKFNYMTRLYWILIGNLILKLICFLQLFDLSTSLGVISAF